MVLWCHLSNVKVDFIADEVLSHYDPFVNRVEKCQEDEYIAWSIQQAVIVCLLIWEMRQVKTFVRVNFLIWNIVHRNKLLEPSSWGTFLLILLSLTCLFGSGIILRLLDLNLNTALILGVLSGGLASGLVIQISCSHNKVNLRVCERLDFIAVLLDSVKVLKAHERLKNLRHAVCDLLAALAVMVRC